MGVAKWPCHRGIEKGGKRERSDGTWHGATGASGTARRRWGRRGRLLRDVGCWRWHVFNATEGIQRKCKANAEEKAESMQTHLDGGNSGIHLSLPFPHPFPFRGDSSSPKGYPCENLPSFLPSFPRFLIPFPSVDERRWTIHDDDRRKMRGSLISRVWQRTRTHLMRRSTVLFDRERSLDFFSRGDSKGNSRGRSDPMASDEQTLEQKSIPFQSLRGEFALTIKEYRLCC